MKFQCFKSTSFLLIMVLSFMIFASPVGAIGVAPSLGSASSYGILGATTTVTGQTNVTGSLGSGGATGTAVVSGSTDVANTAYTTAFTSLGAAITSAESQPADSTGAASDLGGLTLTPGVYKFTGAVTIGSNTSLNGDGVYIFQIDGAFTTSANTVTQLSGGAQSCNIFWVANVATIGANSTLEGTLLSKSAITVGSGSVTNGRVLAQTEVTANAANTRINVPGACIAIASPTATPTNTPTATPSPTIIPSATATPTTTPVAMPTATPVPVIIDAAACTSPSVSVKLDSKGDVVIRAKLPNNAEGTGTWHFNLGGKTYKVKGNEDITYIANNPPVGTYQVGAQFVPDDNGETIDLALCTVSVPTVTGGELPDTAAPWYNLLLAGAVMLIMGISLWTRRRKIHE